MQQEKNTIQLNDADKATITKKKKQWKQMFTKCAAQLRTTKLNLKYINEMDYTSHKSNKKKH